MGSILLMLMLVFTMMPQIAWATGGNLSGEGTAEDPYLIEDAADLVAFRNLVSTTENKSKCASLKNDIDLSGITWTPFTPTSGYIADAYSGTFDGGGHTIKGLNINATASNQGLFGQINGATIKNLNVSGSVTSTNSYVGGIVGKVQAGTIQNCSFSGSVESAKSSSAYAGGIVGGTVNQTTISGCYNTGTITGYAGGILGYGKANISDCYNTGTIKGTNRAGGIVGQFNGDQNTNTANNCYNIGATELSSSSYAYKGGISGYNGYVTNCYWTADDGANGNNTGSVTASKKITSAADLTDDGKILLGTAFVADTKSINKGYPILSWQSGNDVVKKDPKITITGSSTLLMTNSGAQPTSTLKVNYTDIEDTDKANVVWSITSGNDVISITEPENNDDKNTTAIVTPLKGGKATVKATAGKYTDEMEILVVPYITTVEIKNVNAVGTVAQDQTVKAVVNVLGGSEYDYENCPELTYQWYSWDTNDLSASLISGATGREYEIPAGYAKNRIQVEVSCGGQVVKRNSDTSTTVYSSDKGKLYPVAYDSEFTLPTDIKAATTLNLANTHTKEGITANIEWSSNNSAVINAETGAVALPQTGKETVTLTAKFTYNSESCNRTFNITVWSEEEVQKELADKQKPLKEAIAALGGDSYTIHPVWGTTGTPADTNINTVLENAFKAKGYNDITAKVKSVTEVYGNAGISAEAGDTNGNITYFYADPNAADRSVWFGSYKVTFTLTKGDVSLDYEDVPVIIYWDRTKVGEVMTDEILDKVDEDAIKGENTAIDNVTENLVLPKVVDEKKWTQISWTSSNEQVISVSNKNQSTADTLFNPYVGVVKQGATDQTVTLTAKFTFQRTNDVTGSEEPIVLYKAYNVTVKAIDGEQAEKIKADLQAKLDAGFEKAGITDAVTGEKLTAGGDNKYTASNDIKIPTTKDFGVDGKYYPVIITTTDEELLEAPDVNNAARISVIRPAVSQSDREASFTVSIYDKNTSVRVSKTFTVKVPALTQDEIDKEKTLMTAAKEHYFDGIKGDNTSANNILSNLKAFTEVYYDENDNLKWVYSTQDMAGHGIVPEAMDGWQTLEIWRLFKSSNAAVISHENMLVTRQKENKAVTITSALSSETLGKYGKLYKEDPEKYAAYADLADLYYQTVTADLIVAGTNPTTESGVAKEEELTVTFTLNGNDGTWIAKTTCKDVAEGSTAYDIFKSVLGNNNYKYEARGSYVYQITKPNGTAVGEYTEGKDSGWMYKVNGVLPSVYLAQYPLHDGDDIVMFYTTNWHNTWSGMSPTTEDTKKEDEKQDEKQDEVLTPAEKIEKASVAAKKISAATRSSRTAAGIKIVYKPSEETEALIKEMKELGYTVKYRFYRSTKKNSGYKAKLTKSTPTYVNTSGKEGTRYYYKTQVLIYDEDGKLVAKTALKQSRYASRIWS